MPRMQARATERMIPGEEAVNTRYLPPSPSSLPTAHGCDNTWQVHNHPLEGVIPHLCSQVLVLAGLAGVLRGGHLQTVVILQQGFSNGYQDHLKSLFNM